MKARPQVTEIPLHYHSLSIGGWQVRNERQGAASHRLQQQAQPPPPPPASDGAASSDAANSAAGVHAVRINDALMMRRARHLLATAPQ
jgi:hypothetical protein